MSKLRAAVGARLKEFRKAASLTQEELARKVGIDTKYVGDLESGRKAPSFDVLEKLLGVLDLEPSEFFAFALKEDKAESPVSAKVLGSLISKCDQKTLQLLHVLAKDVVRWAGSNKG